jgi:2-aminoethylphosphonate transport system permease protein
MRSTSRLTTRASSPTTPLSDAAVLDGRARARGYGGFWIAPPALLLALLFFYPLALIGRQAVFGDSGAFAPAAFLQVIHAPYFVSGLLNTIVISLASTAGCILVGLSLGLILAFTPFPGSTLIARLIDTFIALPTFLVTLAFTFLYGSAGILNDALTRSFHLGAPPVDFLYSPWGVILAEVTVYSPFVLRPLLAAFSLVESSHIEAASLLGARPWRIVLQVILPAAIPALVAGGSLCLLLTVNEFGIVLFIGAKGVVTLPLLIYDKAIQESDYQTACIIAVINVALSLGLFGLYRFAARRLEA